jgi:septum site-determining protein MinD
VTPAGLVAVHSWTGGVGRTQLCANVGALLARRGLRVALLDAAMPNPSLHVPYRLDLHPGQPSLARHLLGECELDDLLHPVPAERVGPHGGALFVIPAHTPSSAEIERTLAQDYDLGLFSGVLGWLSGHDGLDVVLVDTQSGLNGLALVTLLGAQLRILIGTGDRVEEYWAGLLDRLRINADRIPAVLCTAPPDGFLASDIYRKDADVSLPYSPAVERLRGAELLVAAHPHDPLADAYGHLAGIVVRHLAIPAECP